MTVEKVVCDEATEEIGRYFLTNLGTESVLLLLLRVSFVETGSIVDVRREVRECGQNPICRH